MPVAKGQPIDPAQTRSRVLDTASRLFHKSAVHAVGVNEIASEAGASKLSLYKNFGSKNGLAVRVAADRSERVHAWLRRETGDAPSGTDRVLAVFDLLIDWYARPGFRGCAILNAVIDTRGDGDGVREVGRAHLARYRDLLCKRLIEAGFDDTEAGHLTGQLLLLIEGATAVTTIDGNASKAGIDARLAAHALLSEARGHDRDDVADHLEVSSRSLHE